MSTRSVASVPPSVSLQPEFVLANSVAVAEPGWLWPNWIPLGKLTVLDGDPGAGKSMVLADLAARVSSGGVMPDGSQGASGAVLLVTSESPTDAICPRLRAAGADLSKVTILRAMRAGNKRLPLVLPRDLEHLEELIVLTEAKLLILDPFLTFVPGDVPRTLQRLALLAETTGCAIVLARPLAKGKCREPLYRGAGPLAIIETARSALLVARDPEVPARRVLAPYKSNAAKLPSALCFHVQDAPHGSAKLAWGRESPWRVEQLLDPPAAAEEQSVFNDACRLLEQVALVRPVPVELARREAKRLGISDMTLRRAKQALGLRSRRQGFGEEGQWYWYRPDDPVGHSWTTTHSLEKAFQTQYRDRRPGDPVTWPNDPAKRPDFSKPETQELIATLESRAKAKRRRLVVQSLEDFARGVKPVERLCENAGETAKTTAAARNGVNGNGRIRASEARAG